jgi:3D (Asp-Asp-Asp) domain-containing protein
VIPLGSELLIEGLGLRRAEDTGGWIRGHHIDVYYGEQLSYAAAMSMSRRDRRVCLKLPGGSI